MNFNKCLKTQLYKMLISPVPVICAIMIFGLCCITNVYTDADGGKGYSVLTILLLLHQDLCRRCLLQRRYFVWDTGFL